MRHKNSLLATSLVLVLIGGCAGCAARLPEQYRLTKIGGVNFLLPPDFVAKSGSQMETRLHLGRLQSRPQPAAIRGCSIENPFLSLNRRGALGAWVADVPTPSAWLRQNLFSNARQDWKRFMNQLAQRQSRGCFSPEGFEAARGWIGESIPAPTSFAFYFRYSLDDRGFITLRPGMMLFVERSIFRDPGRPQTAATYLGEWRVYYDVVRQRDGKIALKRRRAVRSKGLSARVVRRFPDASLAHSFAGMRSLRLFLLTLFVPKNIERKGLLIGVRKNAEMPPTSLSIMKNPEIPCRDLEKPGVTCASFEGMVSASVQLNVRVNGKWEYFPVLSTVGKVLKSAPHSEQASALQSLRIQRLFRGRYYNLEFQHGDSAILQLPLFAGDRISWTLRPR